LRHTFEQHELSPLHVSPRGAQIELLSVHVLPVEQALPQHAALEVHDPPATVHVEAVEHLLVAGSQ
jgi:hypothetical protein